ncbi:MAG: hypothetical protein VKL42_21405 [Snowella sp.]|nr:hypothetical protein [Snowella sp.]
MTLAEKSSDLTLSKEEMIRQEAIQTLEKLGEKQNQASLLLLKLQQHLLTWSIITATSFVVLVYFGSSLFCLSPLLKDGNFCRDKSSNNSALIGIITASISVIGVIQTANKRMFIRKLTCDLDRSSINYKALFDSVYTDSKEKESNLNTLSSGGEN